VSEFDIAGICAHPDDAEMVMGGTLAKEAALGRRVALVDLTRGEAGTRGTPETRAAEAQEAARILGALHREALGLPDGQLAVTPEQRDVIVEAIRRLRPRVVVLQHWDQRHPDHAAAGRLVYEASYAAGLRNYRPRLGAPFRPFKLVYSTTMSEVRGVNPSFVVDVTDYWDQKLRAIQAFASQFTKEALETVNLPFERFQSNLELAARRHGQMIGVKYGEGFVTREPVEVKDLVGLSVSSF
jgi:bacillithiol biosynthesis deacetylase BshB1